MEYIFDTWGFHVLDRVLRLCIGTWEGEMNSLSSNMLKGIARLVVTFGEKLRDDIFKEKVGACSAKEIVRTAKDRGAGAMGYAEAMLMAYNKKMKYPLKWSNLYSTQKVSKAVIPLDTDLIDSDEECDDVPTLFEQEEF